MDLDGLVTMKTPPQSRVGKTDCPHKHRRYAEEVMLAYAMHLVHMEDLSCASIHPDGQHNRQFLFADWLGQHGFTKEPSTGTTAYGKTRRDRNRQTISVNPKLGLRGVVAKLGEFGPTRRARRSFGKLS
ncbi:MAG: hypothetical protein F4047_07885 [Caldilineaceae bacterium SB0670_bin_27]|nr:hypothetical protein [Caldilineaceae bacterium SB0670_bin_27]